MNPAQVRKLGQSLDPKRVRTRGEFKYLEAWDVIACLNYIFGFDGWGKSVDYGLIFEEESNARWTVAYHAKCRLIINGTQAHEDVAVGTARNQPHRADAHDLAVKSAVSDALKRAAKDLGNQFGLSLYAGSLGVVGSHSLADPPETTSLNE